MMTIVYRVQRFHSYFLFLAQGVIGIHFRRRRRPRRRATDVYDRDKTYTRAVQCDNMYAHKRTHHTLKGMGGSGIMKGELLYFAQVCERAMKSYQLVQILLWRRCCKMKRKGEKKAKNSVERTQLIMGLGAND